MTFKDETVTVKCVIHVVSLYPPSLGGMEMVVQALARSQQKLGVDVTVLTSDYGLDELPPEVEPFQVIRLKSRTVAHTQIMPGLFPRLLRLNRDSVLHVHVATAFLPELVWACAKLRKHRYVASVYLDVPPSALVRRLLLKPYKELLLKRVLRDAEAIWVPTNDYQDLISTKYGIPRERVIPHPVRDGAPDRRPAEDAAGRRRAEGAVRRPPRRAEEHPVAARGRRRLPAEVRPRPAGDPGRRGRAREKLEAQVSRLGLAGNVTFAGALHGEQLEAAYQDADLLALTSTRNRSAWCSSRR